MKKQNKLSIEGIQTNKGISIQVNGKAYNIEYPRNIWRNTPTVLKQILVENLTVAETHFLPLLLKSDVITYNTPQPLFESLFFKNQLYDLLYCAEIDQVEQFTYMRPFYNLEYEYKNTRASLPFISRKYPSVKSKKPIALLPFTFGKESLVTLGACLEVGIKPILIYSQEPSHPHEEIYKRKKLKELGEKYQLIVHFLKHEPGFFRYGKAFNLKKETELGWAGQTTLLSFLLLPFAWKYGADYILFGTEYSNNDYDSPNGWKVFPSFDQTNFWTQTQNNAIRTLTQGKCEVKSMLTPLEEIVIFHTLHTRYKELGAYQFSCHSKYPLYEDSVWCHKCEKCIRNYLFATTTGIDPRTLGFKKNILEEKFIFDKYLSGYDRDVDLSFYYLSRKNPTTSYSRIFKDTLLTKLPYSWVWYKKHFTTLQTTDNLPERFKNDLITIYQQQMDVFRKLIS